MSRVSESRAALTRAAQVALACILFFAGARSAVAQEGENGETAVQIAPPPGLPPADKTPPIPPCNDDRLETDSAATLTGRQRTCFFLQDLSAPSAIVGAGFGATFARIAGNDPSSFGQGLSAFGLDVATRYAQSAAKSTGEYLGAWIVHDDPRRPRHSGSGVRRVGKAAADLFRPAPIAGALSGGFVALLWEDRNHTTVHQAAMHSLTSFAGSLVWIEFHEFEYELMRWLTNRLSPKVK